MRILSLLLLIAFSFFFYGCHWNTRYPSIDFDSTPLPDAADAVHIPGDENDTNNLEWPVYVPPVATDAGE